MWSERTGRRVRVAVIDSGIVATHPHIGAVAGGVQIGDGAPGGEWTDRIGHGTAVAAAIREKAPEALLYAVRVFDDRLSTTTGRLVEAICWAADAGADVINLSLGTDRAEHAARLAEAVAYASERGSVIVAAEESEGTRWLPGSLPGVVPVRLDWTCPRESLRLRSTGEGPRFFASGYARPIRGVPLEANLKGVSFAVANVSGIVASALQAQTLQKPAELDTIVKHFTQSEGARPPDLVGTRHRDMAGPGLSPRHSGVASR
jgi:subtilisin family serine protease